MNRCWWRVNDNMCPGLAMADENGFVMSYEDAYNLVAETYPGYLEVNESCKITDWQAAIHIYHANEQIMVLLNKSMLDEDIDYLQLKW